MSVALPASTETIEDIRADIGNCTRCPLREGRTQIVHSKGNFRADLMFVGEAPGADEDAQGEPFVGRAGQLLTKIIEGIGFKREDVFIGNINRCRPPGNRAPTLPEAETCKPFLLREIAIVRPKVIVVMGNTATQNLLDTKIGDHEASRRISGLFRRKGNADISSGVFASRSAQETRSLGRYEKSARLFTVAAKGKLSMKRNDHSDIHIDCS